MTSNHEIKIINFKPEETVHYPVIIIKGFINNHSKSPCQDEKIYLHANRFTTFFKVFDDKFKILVELKLNQNSITLTYCCSTITFNIIYVPRQTDFSVLPLYIICKGHNGTFQAPPTQKNDVEIATRKITLAAKLLQSVIAEKLFEESQGRKTFHLENDCKVFYSQLNYLDARKMTQMELWETLGREIIASNVDHQKIKFLGFLSCTWYCGEKYQENFTHEDIVTITQAYVALGGGGLALFGTACLYIWPETLSQVVEKFEDLTLVDRRQFMDDSCYRGTLGACFSTTLGSVLHELCHTFDLGHTEKGIMGRGFDNINKVFITNGKVLETDIWARHQTSLEFEEGFELKLPLREAGKKKLCVVKDMKGQDGEDETFWTKSCVMFLAHHKWMNNYKISEKQIKFDPVTYFISSTVGIRVIEIRSEKDGMVLLNWIFDGRILKYSFQLPEDDLRKLNKKFVIFVEDDIGNIMKHVVDI